VNGSPDILFRVGGKIEYLYDFQVFIFFEYFGADFKAGITAGAQDGINHRNLSHGTFSFSTPDTPRESETAPVRLFLSDGRISDTACSGSGHTAGIGGSQGIFLFFPNDPRIDFPWGDP
jgi:hypothetical protein